MLPKESNHETKDLDNDRKAIPKIRISLESNKKCVTVINSLESPSVPKGNFGSLRWGTEKGGGQGAKEATSVCLPIVVYLVSGLSTLTPVEELLIYYPVNGSLITLPDVLQAKLDPLWLFSSDLTMWSRQGFLLAWSQAVARLTKV